MSFIPGAWSISKCCPNSIRIFSWLRNSHCGERRSHQRLISAVGPFPAMSQLLLYWISPRLHLFNTNTERWHQLQNKLLWNDLLKAKPKRQPSLGSIPITSVGTVWKFSASRDLQGLNCQMLLIDICGISLLMYYRMILAWIWLSPTTRWLASRVLLSQHNLLSTSKSILHSISEDRS